MASKKKSARKRGSSPQSFPRPHSSIVVDGADRAPSRAMLHAVGFGRKDFQKPQIGMASTWSMVTPCNMHIDRLAQESEKGDQRGWGQGR